MIDSGTNKFLGCTADTLAAALEEAIVSNVRILRPHTVDDSHEIAIVAWHGAAPSRVEARAYRDGMTWRLRCRYVNGCIVVRHGNQKWRMSLPTATRVQLALGGTPQVPNMTGMAQTIASKWQALLQRLEADLA